MGHIITRNSLWIRTVLRGKAGKIGPRTQLMKKYHRKYTGKNIYNDLKVTLVDRKA